MKANAKFYTGLVWGVISIISALILNYYNHPFYAILMATFSFYIAAGFMTWGLIAKIYEPQEL